MKRLFALFVTLGLVAGCDAFAAEKEFDSKPIRRHVIEKIHEGRLGELAESSFDAMFDEASKQLRKAGKAQMAADLEREWQQFGADLLQLTSYTKDVGDHDPFSEWVAAWYAKLEEALGVPIMEATHLRDIWVLNYTLKVVFRPSVDSKWCQEWQVARPTDTCQAEYRRHLAGTKWQRHPDPEADEILHHGFAGVVTYWAVYAGCSAAGGFLVCGVTGTGAQFIMERYFAPVLSDSIYERVNKVEADAGCDCGDDCDCGEDCDCEDCNCDHDVKAKEPEAI